MRSAVAMFSTLLPAGQVQAAERQQQEHEAALAAANTAREESDAAAARLERQVAVLGKERDGLKRILASYQHDDASAHFGAEASGYSLRNVSITVWHLRHPAACLLLLLHS